MSKGFSKKSGQIKGLPDELKTTEYKRDLSDNPVFKDYQVNDIKSIITEDCEVYYDADTLYYQAASNQENKFIKVTHKIEGWTEELAGVKVFRGLGKGIKKDSWLWLKNLEREAEGLDPYPLEDFEVEDCSALKGTKDYCLEQAKIQVNMKLKRMREQFLLDKITTVVGSGDNFRHSLPLCRLYKGNRKDTLAPILLKELRKWAVDTGLAMQVPESPLYGNIEVDDYVDMMGWLGALHYDRTGRYNKITILSDKDGNNSAKLICSPDTYSGDHPKKGKFKFPQPYRVPNTKESAGDIEIVAKASSADYKFIGFKGLLWQVLTYDNSDNYNALGHLNGGMGFGTESAYKVLKPCKTAKGALQAMIDAFASVLPYGVQYTDHTGKEWDVPTIDYINIYFRTAYMLRSLDDKMDFYKLCEAFKVDTSAIVNNNEWTPPYEVFNTEGAEGFTKEVVRLLEVLQAEDYKAYKSLKKEDVVAKHSSSEDKIKLIKEGLLANMYITVQRNKLTGEIRPVTKEDNPDDE